MDVGEKRRVLLPIVSPVSTAAYPEWRLFLHLTDRRTETERERSTTYGPDAGHHMHGMEEDEDLAAAWGVDGWMCTIVMDRRISFYNHFDSLGEIREIDHHHDCPHIWQAVLHGTWVKARRGRTTTAHCPSWRVELRRIVNRLTADWEVLNSICSDTVPVVQWETEGRYNLFPEDSN